MTNHSIRDILDLIIHGIIDKIVYEDVIMMFIKRILPLSLIFVLIISACASQSLTKVQVGDSIMFGHYEQDNDYSNGPEEIEWIVADQRDGNILLISKYALDCQPYNTEQESVTWETCSLRMWLNDTFINNAFSEDEQKKIQSTVVVADINPDYDTSPGNDTNDKVFVLSIKETKLYFVSDIERKCQPTKYAHTQGANTLEDYFKKDGTNIQYMPTESKNDCYWCLRSPGITSEYAAFVGDGGTIYSHGVYVTESSFAVRPAIWINLGS